MAGCSAACTYRPTMSGAGMQSTSRKISSSAPSSMRGLSAEVACRGHRYPRRRRHERDDRLFDCHRRAPSPRPHRRRSPPPRGGPPGTALRSRPSSWLRRCAVRPRTAVTTAVFTASPRCNVLRRRVRSALLPGRRRPASASAPMPSGPKCLRALDQSRPVRRGRASACRTTASSTPFEGARRRVLFCEGALRRG